MAEIDDFIGSVVDDKYRLERLLGKGGMGAVYLATHLGTERPVAVKLITPRLMQNEEFVRRFSREAKAAGRLRHPNVVDVTDFGIARSERGPLAYLVMEYLDGCTLADILAEEKRLPLDWVADILTQTAAAVQEAHRLGIVHRDLKPDNIWLEPNALGGYRVKALDFGLAKLAETSPRATTDSPDADGQSSRLNMNTFLAQENHITLDGKAITLEENAPTAEQPLTVPHNLQTEAKTAVLPRDETEEAPTIALPSGAAAAPAPETEAATLAMPAPATDADDEAPTRELSAQAVALQVAGMLEKRLADSRLHDGPPAHSAALDGNVTRVGSIIGTPLYMSPEQCRGERLGTATDIYSLGVIVYQMLSGTPPFTGNSLEILRQHREAAPVPLRERDKRVPRKIAATVMSALEKDPARRPASVEAFANMFRARSESIGTLLQRAVALYSERFTTFFKVSLAAHLPLFLLTALMFLTDGLTKWGYVGATGGAVTGGVLKFANFLANFVTVSLISGFTVLAVLQLSIAPLRPLRGRKLLRAVWRRAKSLVWTGFLAFLFAILLMGALMAVGIPVSLLIKAKVSQGLGQVLGLLVALLSVAALVFQLARYSLYSPVVLVENLKGRAALKRSTQLAKYGLWTVAVIVLVQVGLQTAVGSIAQLIAGGFKEGNHYRAEVAGRLAGMVNVLIIPLTSTMVALLYLKLRQIAGESLKQVLDAFESGEMPASRWQQRMRERLAVSMTSYRSPGKGSGDNEPTA